MSVKIAVIGGTGRIGSQVVQLLQAEGHEVGAQSPSTGVDLLSGQGLPQALEDTDVVVNLTNSPTFDDASRAFFETTMDNLVAAARGEGVGHVVVLSILGIDQIPDVAYYRAKLRQEEILRSSGLPYSIVRAAQFFEFIESMVSVDENIVRLPPTPMQPMAAADVARAVADVAIGAPVQGIRNIAGPQVFPLDELGRITVAARGDHRTVVTDPAAGLFAAVPGNALAAPHDAMLASTTYRDWLAHH